MSIAHIQANPHPTFRRVTIDPEWAKRLLDRNENNRKFSPRATHFMQLCRALENNEWRFNGDAIRVDWSGRLIDGQHRLHAVIETGIPIDTILIEGLNPASQETIDVGKRRTVQNFLSMRGEKNVNVLAAVILRRITIEKYGLKVAFSRAKRMTTVTEQLAYFDAHTELRDVAARAQGLRDRTALNASTIGALMVEFEAHDKDDSDFFWARLADGAGLEVGHPILTLRNSLHMLKQDVKGQRNELYLAALTIKAWNQYRRGESLHLLRYRAGGARPEPFPEVI